MALVRSVTAITASLLALVLTTAGAASQSPTVPSSPEPTASSAPVPVIGPDLMALAPSPAIGPEWSMTLEPGPRSMTLLAQCGSGFTLTASRPGRRSVATWVSGDGTAWRRGGDLSPRGREAGAFSVRDMRTFDGVLYALGGDGPRLAVWSSADCGASWIRLDDRPAFRLGRGGEVAGLLAAATDRRLLVVARWWAHKRPRQRVWALDAGGDWQRVPGDLDGRLPFGFSGRPAAFWGYDSGTGMDYDSAYLVKSVDGTDWARVGRLPGEDAPVWDAAGARWLQLQRGQRPGPEPHVLWASSDGVSWTSIATTTLSQTPLSSTLASGDGVLVWIADATDPRGPECFVLRMWTASDGTKRTCENWSWIATSIDGTGAWSVSAGWPGQWLGSRALKAPQVAVGPTAIVVLARRGRGDPPQVWTLPR